MFLDNCRRLAEPRFLRLLLFGCLFSLVNGITQSAQSLFPYRVLDLELVALLMLEATLRLGQGALSPMIGRLIDQFGNRPVMIVSQTIVALGLLFYLPASREQPWWIVGGSICWIAYAGINIALSSLPIKLAGKEDASLYLAAWFGITGVVYGLSTIVGGQLFNMLENLPELFASWGWANAPLDRYQLLFAVGILGRLLAAASLFLLIEPGASSVRELLARHRSSAERTLDAKPDGNADTSI